MGVTHSTVTSKPDDGTSDVSRDEWNAAHSIQTDLSPDTSDGASLGTLTGPKFWSDLFFASGAVVNWNSGDVTLTHSANALSFAGATGYSFDAGTISIAAGGKAIVGDASGDIFWQASNNPAFQILGTTAGTTSAGIARYTADATGPRIFMGKSRNASIGGRTLVSANDVLGTFSFQGTDGVDFLQGASIEAAIDGTPGASDLPTRLTFNTTADGAADVTERMRIGNDGAVTIGGFPAATTYYGGFIRPTLQTAGNGAGYISTTSYAINTSGSFIIFAKSKNGTVGSHTIVANGDDLGTMAFEGSDGTNFQRAASITAQVDGTPGTADMPGRLTFNTTPDGANDVLERMRIDNTGRVVVGGAAAQGPPGLTNSFQVLGTTGETSSASIMRFSNTNSSASLHGFKSRNATIGSHTIVQNGDTLFGFAAWGSDGTDYREAGQIQVQVDGTPGASDMPGRIVFLTTPDGSSSTTERMRIDSAGAVTIGVAGANGGSLKFAGGTSGTVTIQPAAAAGTYTLTLPTTDGNASEFLQTDGSGNLTWAAGGAGGGSTGKHAISIPAASMISATTNGAASGTLEMTTNKNMFATFDFDATASESVQFVIAMPSSWNESTLTFVPIWSHATTATNFGVVWELSAVAVSDTDAGDVAFGTGQTSTDTGGTTNAFYQGPESSAITVAGTPAANDLVMFKLARLPANASDTLAVDARLHAIRLFMTTDASTDS